MPMHGENESGCFQMQQKLVCEHSRPGKGSTHRSRSLERAYYLQDEVRRPMYRHSMQRWRSYEPQLALLASRLQNAGITCT